MDRNDWDERYREKELLWTAEPNRFVVDAVEGLAPGTALDLAGGEGRNAVWLAEQGWEVTVLEWSGVAIGKGRELAARRGVVVTFAEQDLFEWSPERRFDLVLLVYFQVSDPGRSRVWASAADAVAPDGRLVVIGHDSRNLDEGHGGPQHPDFLYTADDVVRALPEELTVVRAELVERPVENEERSHIALDNVVVATRA